MNKEKEEVEIDLLELGKKLWDNKKFIIKCSIIGAIVGLVIAFSIPKEYTTTVILTTDSGKVPGGSMGALASMAGINLGSTSGPEVFSPELYPTVLNSTPFIQGLLNINVVDKEQNINSSIYNYLKDEQKSSWWGYIFKAPKELIKRISAKDANTKSELSNPRYISEEKMILIEHLRNTYSISTDKKTGIITIQTQAQSPKISAFLADTLTSYLQGYIIEQRTKKAKTDLANSEKLYEQYKNNYYVAQQKLASFSDGNINVISAKYKINQERLQNETNLAYSVYNQMAQQVQMNRIKIQDDTPVFTIIQPAVEPLFPEKPKKKLILIGFVFLTIIISGCWVLREEVKKLIIGSDVTDK